MKAWLFPRFFHPGQWYYRELPPELGPRLSGPGPVTLVRWQLHLRLCQNHLRVNRKHSSDREEKEH
jgi:hypothetical protein